MADQTTDWAARLGAPLTRASTLRARSRADPELAAARGRLRAWQAVRLARTHADLLRDPRFGPAAAFFLSDVYGAEDVGKRDEEVQRVLPTVVKLVPAAGLETIADALELDALSEELDAAMLAILQDRISDLQPEDYGRAYRQIGRREDRERQIALIRQVGHSLERLARAPLIYSTLRLMRRPAQLAGLGALQSFLERGYAAFAKLGAAEEFLEIVTSREQALLEALFAGDDGALSRAAA